MIVYGDQKRTLRKSEVADLIALGQYAQGVFDAAGTHLPELDAPLLAAASGAPVGELPATLPETIEVSEPEGYAFYAVDPELYAQAAESVRHLVAEWTVVGIRSIGTSLGAVVAAALPDARFVTVRPTGHAFARELRPSPYEERVLLDGRGGFYAIVDEGPGLSGSSFLSVASWLESHGVARERIVLFPSHAGEPGAMAADEQRTKWRTYRRVHVPFALPEGVEDLSAGKWRNVVGRWPGVHLQQERIKYRFTRDGETFVAKFEGFGRRGEEMFERATQLAEAGFAPPVVALDRGFGVSEWITGGQACHPGRSEEPGRGARDKRPHPPRSLATLGMTGLSPCDPFHTVVRYLTFREKSWPAPRRGANATQLAEMATFNIKADLHGLIDEVDDAARPIVTDNRLHAWEWIGALKTDGIDHHAAHDLIGCQDLAWDVAGAAIELNLDEERLTTALRRSIGRSWSPRVLHFYRTCYRAFWYGYYTLAAQSCPDEAPRLRREAERYFTPSAR